MNSFKCEPCNLKIENNDGRCSYSKPGFVVPTRLQDYALLTRACETGVCPLCGLEMNKLQSGGCRTESTLGEGQGQKEELIT